MPRRELFLEACEERILCSATTPFETEPAPPSDPAASTSESSAPETATPASPSASSGDSTELSDAQRQAIEEVVRDSTAKIWFEKNVGQFAEGVRYGFKTSFGSMLVYDDHLRVVTTQIDPETGAMVGTHSVDISFTGGSPWQIVPGGASGVLGSYQQADGTSVTPEIYREMTLRNVYAGVDLRLYSAERGVLEFDWLVARAEDYQKIRMQVTGQDGLIFHDDGSATIDLRFDDLMMKLPEVYQVIGGEKHVLAAAMVAGEVDGEIRYRIDGDLVADAPLVIDPNVAWATWFDLNNIGGTFDAYLFAVTANSNGVYAFGYSNTTITNAAHGGYMEGNAGFAQGTAFKQAYIYRLNTNGTNITAWTSTGIVTGSEHAADLELFPDGRVLAGFTSGRIQIYSADLVTQHYTGFPVTMSALQSLAIYDNNSFFVGGRVAAAIPSNQIPPGKMGPDSTFGGSLEGVIIRYSNATTIPTPDWATYVGGSNSEFFTGIALTPDKTKLAFATTTVVGTGYSPLVNPVDSSPGALGTTELLIGVLSAEAAKPAAFLFLSFLGGSGNEGSGTSTASALVTATNTHFYVAGNTASTDLAGATAALGGVTNGGQSTFGGGDWDAFVSRIPLLGSAGSGFQSSYLGGNAEDRIGGIAYDPIGDRLLVFGSTAGGTFPVLNTSPASNYYQGTYGGGSWDIFTATFLGNLATKEFATFMGGSAKDYLGDTGTLMGQGHVFYSPDTGLTYLATTAHSSDMPSSAIGGPPGKDTTKSNGDNDTHIIFAFNLNIFDYGDAPLSYDGSAETAAREAQNSNLRLGLLTDAESGPASGPTATGDDTFNSGSGDDEDSLASIPPLNVGDTRYSLTVAVFNNTGATQTLRGWIDFNRDGTFEAGEIATVLVPSSALQQNVILTWASLPPMTPGQSYLRLRLTDAVLVDDPSTPNRDERSIGTGNFGEIEDYALTIGDTPSMQLSNVTVTEGTNNHAVFALTLSNPTSNPITVSLALANGTATGGGTDFGAGLEVSTNGGTTWVAASTATIATGATSVLIRTPIIDDTLNENTETFTLTATRTAGFTLNNSTTGTATILDNDPVPSLTIDNVTVNEAAGTATFTVRLNTASGLPVSVDYATGSGTATSGADFLAASGTLNFAAGVTTRAVTVTILNDTIFENNEAFTVSLSNPTNATIATGTGVGTILDNGTGLGGADNDTPTLSINNPSVTEGTDAFAVFTISLSNVSTTAVALSLALANGTATGGGSDFGPGLEVSTDAGATWTTAATVTIAAGRTSVLARTPIVNDTNNEESETFTLTATRTSGTTTNASVTGTATIIDDDLSPGLSIGDVTVNEAAGTATFTITLSAPSALAVSVNYSTSNGTATAGLDYTSIAGTLNFAPGVTSQTVSVAIINDLIFERSETFFVVLSAPVNATITNATGTGTILDDGTGSGGTNDDTPTITVSNPRVTEGAGVWAVFTVNLSNPSTTAVGVAFALADGTAGGGDYGPGLEVSTNGGATWTAASTATFAPGATAVLVRTPILDDALAEAPETFTLTATRTAGTTTNLSATGTTTIDDDDAPPVLSIDSVTVNEGAGFATFTVNLGAASTQTVTVSYTTANVTATAGLDYTGVSGTLVFATGVTSQTITVPILNDALFEISETFNLFLSAAVNATIGTSTGVGTIQDNGSGAGGTDNDTPILSVSDVTATEGTDAFAVFAVSLSNLSTTPVTVALALANGTATGGGTDYGAVGATNLQVSTNGGATWTNATSATIAAGSGSILVRTPIIDDSLNEATETFLLTATRTAGTTQNGAATGTASLIDNDGAPALSISNVTVNEAAGTATFTVSLNAPSGQNVNVNYATANGTATAGADYLATSGTLTFAPGTLTRTVTVTILNDAIFEGSEFFSVLLSAPVNATIAAGTGTGTILDNGSGFGGTDNDTPSLGVSSPTVTEGTDPYAIFTVSLSNPSTTAVGFNLALANGTATGGGVDFGAGLEVSTNGGATWGTASNATIAPGSTSVLVRTPIINDALNEAAETFILTATRTSGTTTNSSAAGTATILDNDPVPSIAINDVTVNEAAGTAVFTVTLSTPSGQAVTVNYATGSGTATAGADFTAASGTLTFAAGVTSQTVRVSVLNDATFEGSENFFVVLSAPVNATIADDTGVGTIVDDGTGGGGTDNDTPTLAVSSAHVSEGVDAFAVFTVTLSNASTTAVSVSLALADGLATGGGTDYGSAGAGNLEVSTDGGATWADAASATFAPGATSVLVRTPIVDDAIFEGSEDFTLTATRISGATTNASATGMATIADDEEAPALSINDVTVNEAAGTATFTVTLSSASALMVSVNYATANGTATSGLDFTGDSGTLFFAPGETSQTITISILDDTIFENSESFTVLLSGATNATIGHAAGVGTVLDNGTGFGGADDDTPTLSVSSPTVTEGSSAYAVFTVGLSNAATTAVTFNLALANGTATGGGVDFGPGIEVSTNGGATWNAATSATIAPGSTGVLVRTAIIDDALNEGTENFTLTATRTSGTTSNAAATGTATINDNDATPSLAINDVTVNEAAGTATFTVTLSAASGLPVSVNFATASGTATSGLDFTAASGTLNFAPGVTSQTVTVAILNDSIYEDSESFTVVLSGASNALIADATGVGTILDNGGGAGGTDNDTPTLGITNAAVTEGTDNYAVFTVSLSNTSTTAVDLSFALANSTATGGGVDFGPGTEVSTDGGAIWVSGNTATIAAGATNVLVRTLIIDDALNENVETFTLTATRTGGTTTNAAVTGRATIADNDAPPSVSIDDVTVNERTGMASFTVTLSAVSGREVFVDFTTSDGTATAGVDYLRSAGTLTFAPGVTSQTISVAIVDDAIYEDSENFIVTLSAPVNVTIASGTGIATIFDNGSGSGGADNDTPTLSVGSMTVTEGVNAFAVFTVRLSNPSTTAVDVSFALADDTAIGGGVDYGSGLEVSTDGGATWTSGTTATFTPGNTTILVRTPVVDDTLSEPAETFTLTATKTAGTTKNVSATGVATIVDSGAMPSLTINNVTVNEGAGTATFTVTLSAPSAQSVTVNYTTNGGTATGGDDFGAATGMLTFDTGVTQQTITIPIVNDDIFEQSETFDVTLSAPVNATIANGVGIGTILDDGTGGGGTNDNDTPSLSVSSMFVTEGVDPHAVFTVRLSNASTAPVTVALALADDTATGGGADYGTAGAGNLQVSTNGGATWADATTVTIAAGQTSFLVRTPVIDDTLNESLETFTLTATRIAGTTKNAASTGTATINDNDGVPSISIDDVTVNEAAGTATFTVTLSSSAGRFVTVNYATQDGTATAGSDYAGVTGMLTFAPGVTTQTITVAIDNDSIFEKSETFSVVLSGEVNAIMGNGTGVGTILDDGTGSGGTDDDTPTLSVSDLPVTEGTDAFAIFTVSLSNPSITPVTVAFALADGTANGGGADYGAASGSGLEVSTDGGVTWSEGTTATFSPGMTSVLVRTPVTDDAVNESTETFTLTATRVAGTTANAAATGTATISEDDALPALTVTDVTVNEAAGTLTFTVTLGEPSALTVTVNYATSSNTATEGADYIGVSGTLTFAPGVTSQTITVTMVDDTIFETSESFHLTLSDATNAIIADAVAVGTILDDGTGSGGTDDDTPTLSVTSTTVTEGTDFFAYFTVSLSNPSTSPVNLNLATAIGTARSADYGPALEVSNDGGATWASKITATFAPGETSLLVRTAIIDDALDEADETFTFTATVSGGGTTNASATGTATIIDDDPTPTVVISDATVNEGAGTATFTVTLSAPSGQLVHVDYRTVDGTALAGSDYTATSGTLTFALGQTTRTIVVPILNDITFEGSETFEVLLSNPVNVIIDDESGVATIMDDGTGDGGTDDDRPVVSVANIRVTEGVDAYARFVVSLSNPATVPISLAFALVDGSAKGGGADFGTLGTGNLQVSTDGGATWLEATSATLEPGMTSVLVRTPITSDAIPEATEFFTLSVTVTDGPTINDRSAGTTQLDDPTVTPPRLARAAAPPAFSYGAFSKFSAFGAASHDWRALPSFRRLQSIDVWGPALLPLAPIYSGAADPGATLTIEIFNANGDRIGTQTVLADAGGNWLANFASTTLRDAPSDVRITQINAPYTFGSGAGHNLRAYYAPAAINPGHFLSAQPNLSSEDGPAPLLGGLDLANPLQLGSSKYGAELLPTGSVASD